MDPVAALRAQFERVHSIMEDTVGDTPPDVLHRTEPGGTIGAIAGIYAHVVFSEDRQIHVTLQGKPTLLESGDWADKINVRPPEGRMDLEWRSNLKMDLPAFQEYARAVYAATDAYLGTLSATDLDRKFEQNGREQVTGTFLFNVVATHSPIHLGEIAAWKGFSGLKGLPF
jgi:hypothetical protein